LKLFFFVFFRKKKGGEKLFQKRKQQQQKVYNVKNKFDNNTAQYDEYRRNTNDGIIKCLND